MGCRTLVITVVNTFYRFAVDADHRAGMIVQGISKTVTLTFSKALTTGIIITASMFPTHQDITLAAAFTFVVCAVIHGTL